MGYTPVTINTGDEIVVAWGNKVESNLERIGNYRGVVAAVANLPDVATLDEGDWYWCKSERLVKMKVSGAYISLSASSEVASSAPSSVTGMVWYDTTNKILKVYTGSAWIPIGESLIDTSQALSSLQTALLAQNPTIILNSIFDTAMWNYFLKNSTVRAEVVKYEMYLDAMFGVGSSLLAADTDMEDAILGSADILSIATKLSSFWNTAFLTYWMNNYWTKNNYSTGATTTVQPMNSKYGFRIYCNAHWITNFPYFSVDIDLTDFDNLDFWYSYVKNTSGYVKLFIGATQITQWGASNVSGTYNVDISGYSGVQTIKFQFNDYFTSFDFTDLTLS